MATRYIHAETGALRPRDREAIAAAFAAGGLVAFPTESSYGLGGSPWDEVPGARIRGLKGERGGKPLPLILASRAAVLRVAAALPETFHALADTFWPGPLTLILPCGPTVSRAVTAEGRSVGVRVPDHALARTVAELAGGACIATSANPSGAPAPGTAEEVAGYFADRIDLLIAAGTAGGARPSTIVDLTAEPPRLLRAGPVSLEALRGVCPGVLDPAAA